jgi:hypothetical protein
MERTGASQSSAVLRGLARAAIVLADHPAALRVLCIVAENMGEDATCSISQGRVADRLGISRQAANKHFGFLDRTKILTAKIEKAGLLKCYQLWIGEPHDGD